jgi:hypothetical protein
MTPEIEEYFRRLEWWTDRATLSPDQRVVQYAAGALVMHRGQLYRARVDNELSPPDEMPALWELLPSPADDVRLTDDSPHSGLGLR